MPTKEENQAARERVIINSLTEPKSAQQIADEVGISYYTMKPYLNDMVKRGMIQTSAFRIGHATLYQRISESDMPLLQHYGNKQWVSPVDIIRTYIPGEQTGSAKAALTLGPAMWGLIALAKRVELGASTEEDAQVLRRQIVALYKDVMVAAEFYKQLLDNESIWTEAGLRLIASSSDFPSDEELARYAEKFGS